MITTPRPTVPAGEAAPAKRSILGLLFNPQLGPAISPLRESTQIFLRLLAGVFAIYKLLPKDYPGLRDDSVRLSFFAIIGAAWRNVSLTREGAPRAILFFAVTGMMGFGAFFAIATLLSLCVGHAHAATASSSSMFTAPNASTDLAQSWLTYLFDGPSGGSYPAFTDQYGDATAVMADPFKGSTSLQKSLMDALAFYSDAILIIAAIILFYHLTSMVVETAHHGNPMGKRASQIWAPIRLVVAIGLLVPVNGGLNTGQLLVVKVAELGSGLASQTWGLFLNQLASYSTTALPPNGPMVQQVGADIIRMEACRVSWNAHVQTAVDAGMNNLSSAKMDVPTAEENATVGTVTGTKYHYSSKSLADTDICGWYFIPGVQKNSGINAFSAELSQKAAQAQLDALDAAQEDIQAAANKILVLIPPAGQSVTTETVTPMSLQFDALFLRAIASYQTALNTKMATIADGQQGQISDAINNIRKYGWVMAGTFLNTIGRMQGGIGAAAESSTPLTHLPLTFVDDDDKPKGGFLQRLFGSNNDAAWNIRKMTADDMGAFDFYQSRAVNSSSGVGGTDAQCAAMFGATPVDGAWTLDFLFGRLDSIATHYGVWSSGATSSCGGPGNKPQTFSVGIKIDGTDPIAQLAALGNANINAASNLVSWAMGFAGIGGIASAFENPLSKIAGGITGGIGALLGFLAVLFFVCGFTLSYLVPLMPYMRFFFSVLAWVGALIEAIVAIPLVALAHLNPEGEGLSGQAKGAYFFIFNLFLRPVLTVFGLVCGLIVFFIALSFLNYSYETAVAGAGGTAYGRAAMARTIYSILYVGIVYICANQCFKLIDHLPEHALRWMGQSGQAIPKMGDASDIERIGALAASFAGDRTISKMTEISGSIGKGGGAAGGAAYAALKKRRDKKKADAARLAGGGGASSEYDDGSG